MKITARQWNEKYRPGDHCVYVHPVIRSLGKDGRAGKPVEKETKTKSPAYTADDGRVVVKIEGSYYPVDVEDLRMDGKGAKIESKARRLVDKLVREA